MLLGVEVGVLLLDELGALPLLVLADAGLLLLVLGAGETGAGVAGKVLPSLERVCRLVTCRSFLGKRERSFKRLITNRRKQKPAMAQNAVKRKTLVVFRFAICRLGRLGLATGLRLGGGGILTGAETLAGWFLLSGGGDCSADSESSRSAVPQLVHLTIVPAVATGIIKGALQTGQFFI